jgi:hypothetical protein
LPPFGPGAGACSIVLSLDVHSVCGEVVMSWNLAGRDFFVNSPNALNWTGLATPVGAVVGTQVGTAEGSGVNVGVILEVGVGFGVLEPVGDGVNDGVVGGPLAIVMAWSEKPTPGVEVVPLLLPPPQLSRIAPNTNNTTGATTSHLSHRDNIKPRAMPDGIAPCQVDTRLTRKIYKSISSSRSVQRPEVWE